MECNECHDWLSKKLVCPYPKFFHENKETNKNNREILLKTFIE